MNLIRTLIALTIVFTLSSYVASDETDLIPIDNSRKKPDEMAQMYMAFMMFKTLLSTIMSLISPIIQIKSFGLSVIGTLINIARFVLMLKQQQHQQQGPPLMNAGKVGWNGENYKRTAVLHSDAPEVSSYSPYYNSYEYSSRAAERTK